MLCWADGGWDRQRGIGYAAVHRPGDQAPVVVPVFEVLHSAVGCELRAIVLAISLTPNDQETVILTDCQGALDLITGRIRTPVLEFAPYVRWARRHLGDRQLRWSSREGNLAHMDMGAVFDPDDTWSSYEFDVLREQKQGA